MKYTAKKGEKFSRLEVTGNVERKNSRDYYELKCDCGNVVKKLLKDIFNGRVSSCGCLAKELTSKRSSKGRGDHKLAYSSWSGMIQRCTNKKNPKYENYGGRGIGVCDEWLLFDNFIKDMGDRPSSKHSIGRIDNNLGYSKENCKWENPLEQARNTRRSRLVDFNDVRITVTELARINGINPDTLYCRLDKGMSVEDAIKNKKYNVVNVIVNGKELILKDALSLLNIPTSTFYKRKREGLNPQEIINLYLN